MPVQLVVGAAIVDSLEAPTTVLAARRSRPARLRGRWEFPGGKVEPGETAQMALVREVREELGVLLRVGPELVHEDRAWPISRALALRVFLAEVASGWPEPRADHDAVRWLTRDMLWEHVWLPADQHAVLVMEGLLDRRPPSATSSPPRCRA